MSSNHQHPHQRPTSIRYLKARFRPLLRPQVWGTVTVLGAIGFGTWAYYNHPEWLALTENQQILAPSTTQPGQADISAEDKAIGADIDNLSVLQQDLAIPKSAPLAPNSETEQREQNLFDEFIKKKEAAQGNKSAGSSAAATSTEQPSIPNPVGIQATDPANKSGIFPNLGGIGGGSYNPSAGTVANPIGSLNTPSSSDRNPTQLPVSPLQSALDRATGNNPSIQNPDRTSTNELRSTPGSTQTPTDNAQQNSSGLRQQDPSTRLTPSQETSQASPAPIPGQANAPVSPYTGTAGGYSTYPGTGYAPANPVPGATGYNVPPYTNNNPPNSYTYLNQPQAVPGVPPAAQVNPQVAPGTPSNLGQSPFQNSISGNGYNNPGYNPNYSNPGTPQSSQLQQQPNFSVPRPIPGRYIGGGEINSFSNP